MRGEEIAGQMAIVTGLPLLSLQCMHSDSSAYVTGIAPHDQRMSHALVSFAQDDRHEAHLFSRYFHLGEDVAGPPPEEQNLSHVISASGSDVHDNDGFVLILCTTHESVTRKDVQR